MINESIAPLWYTSNILQKYWIAYGDFLFYIAKTNSKNPLKSTSPLTVWYSSYNLSITIAESPLEYLAKSSFFKVPFLSESSLQNLWNNAVAYWTENQFWFSSYSEYLSCLSS